MKLTYKHTQKACYMAYITGALINNFATLLYLTFQTTYGITLSQVGFLMGLNFAVQIVVDLLGAHYCERIGYRRCIIAAHFFAAAGLMLMAVLTAVMPNKFAALIISITTYAVGSGLLEVLISPITEALPSEHKSANMSLLHSFYCWGSVLVVGLSILFFTFFGTEKWQVLSCLWALLPLVTMVIFIFVPINTLKSEKSSMKSMFASKTFIIFMILMACSGAGEIAMAQWASFFAESGLGVSKTVGDLLGPCLFAVFMGIGRVIYPMLSGKIKLARYLTLSSAGCAITYLIASLSTNAYVSLMGCAFTGLFIAVAWPGVLSLASKHNPQGGTAMFAILALAGDLGCTLGPQVVVLGANKMNILSSPIHSGLLLSAAFPVIMIVCLNLLKQRKHSQG